MSQNNYSIAQGTTLKISRFEGTHSIVGFLNSNLQEVGVKQVFLFYVKRGFFSRKQLFLAFCYENIAKKQSAKNPINTLLDKYFNENNDSGINIISLAGDVKSDAGFIRAISSQIEPFFKG